MKYALLIVTLLINLPFLSAQWEEIASPPFDFRTDHSFGFAINGVGYLVAGATPDDYSDDFYRYFPETDTWNQLPDFPGGTRGFGIGDVWEGKAYFGFGAGTSPGASSSERKNDLWEFDPASGIWKELASCPCDPRLHPAFVTHKGNIYVGLGSVQGVGNVKDWWQYNIATDTWTQKADFPSHERHHPYQFALGDYVYAGFGHGTIQPLIYQSWYRYDPEMDTWDEVASIPGEGRVAGTQFSHNGKGYALSGDGEDHQSMDVGEFWEYDPETDSWKELPPHPGFSRWAPASFILNNEVYLINGSSFGNYQDKAYKYKLEEPNVSSTKDNFNASSIRIYPNPFSDQLNFLADLENVSTEDKILLLIYDGMGKLVFKSDINTGPGSQNLEHLQSGIYQINLSINGKNILARKVVKL